MTLRLSIVSEHGIRLGTASTRVFGVHGGSIGRGTDNEWILPDPERYLSGKHARVDFRAGAYLLVDTSTNGTYLNGAPVPLGKHHEYLLKDGDYVRLGEYELLVSIDTGNDFPPDESAIVAYDGQAASSAVRKSTADDIGADIDLTELLDAGDRGRVAAVSVPPATPGPAAGAREEAVPAQAGATPWHLLTRPVTAGTQPEARKPQAARGSVSEAAAAGAAATPRAQPPPSFETDVDAGFAAFCRGAGVSPRALPADARSAALQLAGQLLRESVLGLMELNQSSNEFRHRFHLAAVADEGADSPLNFSRGVEEALIRLLTRLSPRAGSVEAIRQNFRELKAQNLATLDAMHAAFEEFLARMQPEELQQRFERAAQRGVFGAQNKGRYWDLYAEMFAGLAQRPAAGFPHLYAEGFARAFDSKMRRLIPPRRSVFGGDRHEPGDRDDAVGKP